MELILIAVCFAGGLLVGVFGSTITLPQERIAQAQTACTNNAGVKEIKITFQTTTAICNNNAQFTLQGKS